MVFVQVMHVHLDQMIAISTRPPDGAGGVATLPLTMSGICHECLDEIQLLQQEELSVLVWQRE